MITDRNIEYQSDISLLSKSNTMTTLWDTLCKILNSINHAIILTISLYLCYLCFIAEEISPLEIHIICCVLGWVLLTSEAIMLLCNRNGWSSSLSKRTQKHLHWIISLVGGLLTITGIAIFYNSRSEHFHSTHSKLGLASMVFLIPTFFGGLFTFFSRSFSAYIRPLYIKLFHYLLACVGFPLAIAALCYGYKKKWFALNHSEESITFLIVITSISAIITMRTPLTKVTRLVKKCFE